MAGKLKIKDRTFKVVKATIQNCGKGVWFLEIDAEEREYDGESWVPQILHQGLKMGTDAAAELAGKSTSWKLQDAKNYPHPEIAMLSIFGHHDIHHCTLRFEKAAKGLRLHWEGQCDVFWDDVYSENLPFLCECTLKILS